MWLAPGRWSDGESQHAAPPTAVQAYHDHIHSYVHIHTYIHTYTCHTISVLFGAPRGLEYKTISTGMYIGGVETVSKEGGCVDTYDADLCFSAVRRASFSVISVLSVLMLPLSDVTSCTLQCVAISTRGYVYNGQKDSKRVLGVGCENGGGAHQPWHADL